MSKPADGNYYIVNRETTSDGTSLAIQYNGEGALLTVTELGSQPTQVWTLITHDSSDGSQFICPEDATSLEVNMSGSNNLTVDPAGGYFWVIRGTEGIYTIQDGDLKYFWGINSAEVGQDVHYSSGDDKATQDWQLVAA